MQGILTIFPSSVREKGMPYASSSMTARGASLHMYSIASCESTNHEHGVNYSVRQSGTSQENGSYLVAKPIRALHRVVEVPAPIIFGHIAQSGIDTALCSDSVRPAILRLRMSNPRTQGNKWKISTGVRLPGGE